MRRRWTYLAAVASLCSAHATYAAPVYDLVLQGGRVIDPASGLDGIRDVGISNGTVKAVADAGLKGRATINARGLVVAPGFIDLHAHGQYRRGQELQALDGVTTAIDMEAGAYPVDAFYARREGKMLINFGASVGHRCVRVLVVTGRGCGDRIVSETQSGSADTTGSHSALEPADERKMLDLMKVGLAQGGLGFGLGIDYTPGSSRAEIYNIFKLAGRERAPVHVHVRRRATDFAKGIGIGVAQEVIADAVLTDAPLQILHISSTAAPADVPVLIEMVEQAQKRGFDITTEAYPYTASSTAIGSAIFEEGWRLRTGMKFGDLQWARTGERLTEASFNRYRADQPSGTVIMHSIPEEAVRQAMASSAVSIASDGMWWVTGGEHPRGAGTFARVLGHYVREERALDLSAALAKMTIMPAKRLEKVASVMRRKGRISEGADADLTVFDPKTIIDRATWSNSMQPSAGIRHVLVGGQFVVRDGTLVPHVTPGKGIRRDLEVSK